MNKNVKVEISEYGNKKLDEIVDKAYEWMGNENTVGDFMITVIEEMVEEWLGEEICSMTLAQLENDDKSRMKMLERLAESQIVDVFVKARRPGQLVEYMI